MSLRESRIESSRADVERTTARKRHRSWCLVSGKVSVQLPAGGEPVGFKQYIEGGRVHRGQVTLSIVFCIMWTFHKRRM